MKKFAIVALSLVCVLACTFILTACAEGPYNNKAWKMKSEEVTAEEWEAAFDEANFENVKVEITQFQTGEYEREDGTTEDIDVVIKTTVIIVGDVHYYKESATVNKGSKEVKDQAKDMNKEGYFTKEQDGSYTVVYKDDNGKWAQDTASASVPADELATYISYGEMRNMFKYNAELFCYVVDFECEDAPWEMLYALNGIRLKFQGGKYAAYFSEFTLTETVETTPGQYEGKDIARFVKAVVFTYGGQQLTVPTPNA